MRTKALFRRPSTYLAGLPGTRNRLTAVTQCLLVSLWLLVGWDIASASGADTWIELFDGKSLAGWDNPYDYGESWVEDGAICLRADKKFFLVTEKKYSDFILEVDGKAKNPLDYIFD